MSHVIWQKHTHHWLTAHCSQCEKIKCIDFALLHWIFKWTPRETMFGVFFGNKNVNLIFNCKKKVFLVVADGLGQRWGRGLVKKKAKKLFFVLFYDWLLFLLLYWVWFNIRFKIVFGFKVLFFVVLGFSRGIGAVVCVFLFFWGVFVLN